MNVVRVSNGIDKAKIKLNGRTIMYGSTPLLVESPCLRLYKDKYGKYCTYNKELIEFFELVQSETPGISIVKVYDDCDGSTRKIIRLRDGECPGIDTKKFNKVLVKPYVTIKNNCYLDILKYKAGESTNSDRIITKQFLDGYNITEME